MGVPGVESDPSKLGFSWIVTDVSPELIELQISFADPLQISQNEEPDYLSVKVNMDYFVDENNLPLERQSFEAEIPRQLSTGEAEAIGAGAAATQAVTTAVMGSNFVINLVMAASLSQLWSMLNGL